MSKEKTTKSDYIRNYIIENDLYTMPSRTLAKAILNSNPKLFGEYNDKNTEGVRYFVRKSRYSTGNNKTLTDKLFAEKFHGYLEPDINDYSPFIIPKHIMRLGILNDIHIPFHNKANLNAAIQYLKNKQIDGLLLNGDILDCYMLSYFMKDPRLRRMVDEFNVLREFIDNLNYTLKCPIFYKFGNHEDRMEMSVFKQIPELVEFINFENCLSDRGKFDLKEYGVTIIKDKRIVKFTDNLSIIHGHEYRQGMSNPVGVARWLFMKAKCNAACGHAHRKSTYSERNIEQHTTETNSIGCLSEMNPKWMPLNNWDAGFAYVRRMDNDQFKFSNLLIENGVVF